MRATASPLVASALTALLLLVFVAARLASHDGRPGAFVTAGDRFASAAAPDDLVVTHHATGYDGQFVYRLALDPLTSRVSDHGITLDNPAYRAQRVVLPALGWAVDRVPGMPLSAALLLVNAVALLVAAWAAASLAEALGRSPLWGAAVALSPPLLISFARVLTECTALAALLVGLLLWHRRRPVLATVAFVVAVLARETVLSVLAGMGVWLVWRAVTARDRAAAGRAALLVAPLATDLAWQAHLHAVWGDWPSAAGAPSSPIPLLAPLRSIFDEVGAWASTASADLLAHAWLVERLLLVGFIVAVFALVGRSRLDIEMRMGAVAALAVPLTLTWRADVQFVRAAAEGVVLGMLVLLGARGRMSTAALTMTVGWSLLVGGMYAAAL